MKKLDETLTIDNADQYRFDNCKLYEKCLDIAIEHHWVSFSCENCENYDPYTIILEIYTEPRIEPPCQKGGLKEFDRKLTQKMRDLGIPMPVYNSLGVFLKKSENNRNSNTNPVQKTT
jgi:hypothetical protein